jgi:hypothetical protein
VAYARITLQQLKDRLAERIGGQNKFWTEPEREAAINEALAVWQLMTGDFTKIANVTVTHSTYGIYLVDAGADQPVAFLRLKVDNTPVNQLSLRDLDKGFYGWRSESSTSTPEYWAPVANNLVALHQAATDQTQHDAQTFNAMFLRGDRLLTSDSDNVQLGDEEVLAIIAYAQACLAFKQGESEAFDNSKAMRTLFGRAAARRGSWLRGTSIYRKFMGQEDDHDVQLRHAGSQKGVRS